jgi:hypothetical protein
MEIRSGAIDASSTSDAAASSVDADVEVDPPPLTYVEVVEELRDSLTEPWAQVSDVRMHDVATGILRLSKEQSTHPLIMADEVAEFADTVIVMQPQFLIGERQGGLPRALNLAWEFYRATKEIAEQHCSILSDEQASFTQDDPQVPKVSPYVLLSLAHRESRLALKTERGYMERHIGKQVIKVTDCLYCRGAGGERSMFQFIPAGGRGSNRPGATERRFHPGLRPCDPFDSWCAVQTAVKALAVYRCECIAAFGSRCTVDSYVASYGVTRLVAPESARFYRGNERARTFLCAAREDCDLFWPRDVDEAFALGL